MINQLVLLIAISLSKLTFAQTTTLPIYLLKEDTLKFSVDTNNIIVAYSCLPIDTNLTKKYLQVQFMDEKTFKVVDSISEVGNNCMDIKLHPETLKSYPNSAIIENKTKGLKIKSKLKQSSINQMVFQHDITTIVTYKKKIIAEYEISVRSYQKNWKKHILVLKTVWKVDENTRFVKIHLLDSPIQVFKEHRVEYLKLKSL